MKFPKASLAVLLVALLAIAGALIADAGPSQGRGARVPRAAQGDSVQVPTLQAFRQLQRRVAAIEAELAEPVDPPVDPPVRPPVRPRPPVDPPDRPTNPGRAPPISLVWAPREGVPTSFTFDAGAYAEEERDGIGFRCWVTKAPDLNAWMVTVAAINGHKGRGVVYFERLQISTPGRQLLNLRGRHVILPRGAILRRYWLGPDAEAMESWDWVEDPRPFPSWAPERSLAALDKDAAQVGPYRFHWPYKSLDNSHGGQGVAPFHGGPEDWNTSPEGRRLREKELLAAYQRPIWLLGPTPAEPYWMGRTMAHRLQGYDADPDGWCPYAQALNEWRPADHTHLSRTTAGAAALAKWDPFARDCLLMSWKDFKAANSLTRPKVSSQKLLWPLWAKVEVAAGPLNTEGDRGLGHWLRLMRWVRPYVDAAELDPYQEAYRTWVGKLGNQYGVTRITGPPSHTNPPAPGVVPPYVQAFHAQLNLYEFQRFGGLDDQAERLANYLTPLPAWYFEARDGPAGATALDHGQSAGSGYPAYGTMTHGVLQGYNSPAHLLEASESRGVNGASQDLDCIPRAIWEPGLGS